MHLSIVQVSTDGCAPNAPIWFPSTNSAINTCVKSSFPYERDPRDKRRNLFDCNVTAKQFAFGPGTSK